ncbi:GAF domain-like protein [Lichtheimia hyalospora FSU 10163]|nr:GAF domain-like protein [Lichtheimia hyalospora FSU 10163]
MFDIQPNSNPLQPRDQFYNDLLEQIKAIVEGQRNWVTNLANASAVIYHELRSLEHFQSKPINWAGFYLVDPTNAEKLILGPFQGKLACTEIPFGKGVCGAAAATQQTQVIKDVHQFPGHIACDSASNSEIVVPMLLNGKIIGVLDIDCEKTEGFNDQDRVGLEAIVKVLVESCEWNQ